MSFLSRSRLVTRKAWREVTSFCRPSRLRRHSTQLDEPSRQSTRAGVITPFPGGVARSGSKVGSRYKKLPASTADTFCPTLRGRSGEPATSGGQLGYEIVIDGVDEAAVAQAMTVGMRAAAGDGIVAISAGNYGGQLGEFQFQLHELLK